MPLGRPILRSWAFAAFLTLAPIARGDVWIASNGAFGGVAPGADFAQVYQAVAAASDGDTILVRSGTFQRFTVSGKSLTIVADGTPGLVTGYGSSGLLGPGITVASLAPGQSVVVRGLRTDAGVRVTGCAGSVWFDEVQCTGKESACSMGMGPGADLSSSERVTFTRCLLKGEIPSTVANFTTSATSQGLRATGSTVQLFDCTAVGGIGPAWWQTTTSTALPGAPGMRLDGCTLTLVGCAIAGGAGGRGGSTCDSPHAMGGAGIAFEGSPSTVRSAASTAVGGVLSLEPLCPGQTGPPGPAIAGTSTIVPLPGLARSLRANGPVRGGQTLTFELAGQPGEAPLLVVSARHDPLPLLNGTLLVGLPQEDVFVLPPLDASGAASLAFAVPDIGAALGGLTLYAQAVFLGAGASIWLGAGTTVALLAAGV